MRKLFLLIILILALLVPGTAVLADGLPKGPDLRKENGIVYWGTSDGVSAKSASFWIEQSDEELTSFPVYLNISDSVGVDGVDLTDIFDELGADWKKLYIISNGISLPVEVVSWDTVNKKAELHFAVDISDTDKTSIILRYDNPFSDNPLIGLTGSAAGKAVWNEDYVFVSHMNDDAAGTGILDSTSYKNDGTKVGSSIEVSGLVGKAQQFNGSSDYITIPSSDSLNSISTELTIEVVVKTSADQWQCPVARGYHWSNDAFGIWDAPEGGYFLRVIKDGGGEDVPKIAPFFNIFGLISATYDNGTGKIYRDGELKQTKTGMSDLPDMTGMALTIGRDLYDYYWNGLIDEIRISKTARSASWVATADKSLKDNLLNVAGTVTAPKLLAFSSIIDSNNIVLNWEADYADSYIVVRGGSSYPTSLTDGVRVYEGSDLTYTDLGVASELDTYYYSIWALSDNWGASLNYLSTSGGGSMGTTILFGCLMALGCFLTWFASKRPEMLISFAAGITWLGLAFWVLLGDLQALTLADSWTQMLGWVFVIMAFIPFILQMNVEIKKEKQGTSWSTYGKEPVDQIRPYEDYKDRLYSRTRKNRR